MKILPETLIEDIQLKLLKNVFVLPKMQDLRLSPILCLIYLIWGLKEIWIALKNSLKIRLSELMDLRSILLLLLEEPDFMSFGKRDNIEIIILIYLLKLLLKYLHLSLLGLESIESKEISLCLWLLVELKMEMLEIWH